MQTFEEEDIAEINAVIIETRRDDFYVQLFDRHQEKKSEPQALMREDIIPQLKGRLVSLAGDGVERFLSTPSGLCLHAIKMYDFLPAEALLKAGLKALSAKKLNFPKPLYLRAPDVSLPKRHFVSCILCRTLLSSYSLRLRSRFSRSRGVSR